MHRRTFARLACGLLVFTLTACGAAPHGRWVDGTSGTGGSLPAPSPTPSPSPTAVSPYAARIPKFPPAPEPQPIARSAGPLAPMIKKVPTTQPVAFITIDDGLVRKPEAIELIRAAGVPVTLFLISREAVAAPDYFRQITRASVPIETHTVTHTSLAGRGYDLQHREICQSADKLAELYGRRPVFFRPPYGEYDQTTLRAAHDCGMRAVFYWTQTVDKGIVRYQTPVPKVEPGDIILMHFREAFVEDFLAALKAIHDAGLTPALLEDYV